MTPEGKIKAAIVKLLNLTDLVYWRNNSGFVMMNGRPIRMGCPGLPDICIAQPDNRVIYIELKRPGGKFSASQLEFIRKTGAVVRLVDSRHEAYWVVASLVPELRGLLVLEPPPSTLVKHINKYMKAKQEQRKLAKAT